MSNEAPPEPRSAGSTLSAGALLREARKAQGMHLAAIAASIKVAPQKLEALENDRLDQLPDPTFTRALAQAMCRVLKIDPQPVLARLPQGMAHRLERLEGGLNQPFRARDSHVEPRDWSAMRSPAVWGPALLVLGAALLLFVPFDTLRPKRVASADAEAPPAAASAPAVSASAASTVSAAAAEPAAASAVEAIDLAASAPSAGVAAPSAPAAGSLLVLRASEPSWVEVRDAGGQVLISRTLQPGEDVNVDGAAPFKVRIGNAKGTMVVFRGETIDPAKTTRDNIARLELK
ncbi:MAG TPA: helix-turn-helix domain-containing protein [Ideonella sp.]|nr:helix-turn-helix domain-containing protein [Ideonella sp.]